MNWTWLHRLGSPAIFYRLAGRLQGPCLALAGLLLAVGLGWGLFLAPPDYQQGDSFRIIYVHVPAAFLAQSCYLLLAVAGAIGLVWRLKLADVALRAAAPIGAWMTVIALATGSLWGIPTWGTWWIWDARLTSMLVLLFLYLGVIALGQAIDHRESAARPAPSWRWWARSICRSSSIRWSGGAPCTSRPPSAWWSVPDAGGHVAAAAGDGAGVLPVLGRRAAAAHASGSAQARMAQSLGTPGTGRGGRVSGVEWAQALGMGRHGLYVWPAFGLTLIVLGACCCTAGRRVASCSGSCAALATGAAAMNPVRRRRLLWILLLLLGVGGAAALALSALQQNIKPLLYPEPDRPRRGAARYPHPRRRHGGEGQPGARRGLPGGEFRHHRFPAGGVGELCRHPAGSVPRGQAWWPGSTRRPGAPGADQILAKHDEKYMPPEVSQALRQAGRPLDGARPAP